MNTPNPLYECADFFMVRTALLPTNVSEIKLLEQPEELLKFSQKTKGFLEAIALASPSLYKALRKWPQPPHEETRKIYEGVLKYFLRMYSRATPFGAFSFVSWGVFSKNINLNFDLSCVKKKARLDMEWLNCLIDSLHKDNEFVKTIKVMINPNVFKEGEKIALIRFNAALNKYDSISIKNTIVTEQIFLLAKKPIIYSELIESLAHVFSDYPQEKVEHCLWSLFEGNYLLSELSFRIDQPFVLERFSDFVNSRLDKITNKETHSIAHLLTTLSNQLTMYEQQGLGYGISLIDAFIEKASPYKTVEYPLQVDTYLSSNDFQLNEEIRYLIEETATVIYYMTSKYGGDTPIKKYHLQFLEKYGSNRLIPIQQLINSAAGLAYPLNSQEKEEKKEELQDIILGQTPEFLKEIDVESWVKKEFGTRLEPIRNPPDSLEMFFEIASPSLEEMAKGNFTMIMNPVVGSVQAGSTFGRFLYIWDALKKTSLRTFLEKEEALQPDIVRVEASFHPKKARLANVCYFEKTRQWQLKFHYSESSDGFLEIKDIYVGANEKRLYLFSKTLGKEIHVNLSTAVNPSMAPPILKFMIDISERRFDYYSPSIIEPYGHFTYLPRFRYKNVILSPARWYLNDQNLGISKDTKPTEVEKKLIIALADYHIPDEVFMTEFDNRLKVSWKKPNEFKLMLDKLIKTKELILYEYLHLQEERLIKSEEGYHVAEFVVPLVRRAPVSKSKPLNIFTFPPTTQIPLLHRNKFPGISDWLYVKIFLSLDFENDFISLHLKDFANSLVEKHLIDKWFYIRYNENNRSHIRFRVQGVPEKLVDVVFPSLSYWCSQLIEKELISDFSFHSYEREIERYGGPDSIEAIENIFSVDSIFCANLIDQANQELIPFDLEYMAALSIINMLKGFYFHIDTMLEVLMPLKEEMNVLNGSRHYLKQLLNFVGLLINPERNGELINSFTFLTFFEPHFKMFADRIKTLRHLIEESFTRDISWNNPHHLLDSIIHMHCNRLLGSNLEREKKARVIAYSLLRKYKNSPLLLQLA